MFQIKHIDNNPEGDDDDESKPTESHQNTRRRTATSQFGTQGQILL